VAKSRLALQVWALKSRDTTVGAIEKDKLPCTVSAKQKADALNFIFSGTA